MAKVIRPPVFREDGTIEIHLTRGYVAIIDSVDAHLAEEGWYAMVTETGHAYAYSSGRAETPYLHRAVLGLGAGRNPNVDHQDGDTMNCRRANLVPKTQQQNLRNRTLETKNESGMAGVRRSWNRWRVTLSSRTIGYYGTLEEAKAARLKAERDEWGVQPRRAEQFK